MEQDNYEVVWPLAPRTRGAVAEAERPETLRGARIGLVWNEMYDGDVIFAEVQRCISDTFGDVEFVQPEEFGNFHGRDEYAVVAGLPQRLRDSGARAVVVGVGGSGTDTAAVMRACAIAESNGIAAVAVIASGFLAEAAEIGRAQGIPHVPVAEYPGQMVLDEVETIRTKARDQVAPAVGNGLTRQTVTGRHVDAMHVADPAPRDIVFAGSLDAVQEHFESHLWTDGLPIVPPTLARVEEFLAHVDRDPTSSIGVLPAEEREATVWSIAVNGVMAGCRPEYMPVLVAIVEVMADPEFRLQDAGSTPGYEPLVILSGPVVQRLGFATGPGLMRVGSRANTSLGRFVRLFMRNVCGFRTAPGATDMASIGLGLNVAMAEDDAPLDRIGWEPLRVERGFDRADSVVTVQSVIAISQPIFSSGATPEPHLELITFMMQGLTGGWIAAGLIYDHYHPLLLLSPSVAAGFAEHGLSKDDVREYIFNNAKVEARWLDAAGRGWGDTANVASLVERGEVPAVYGESNDPHRLVPALLRPESTTIVVAGDPMRNQSRIYLNNHAQAPPLSRRIELLSEHSEQPEGGK